MLLLGANTAVLVLPLLALVGLRLYDAYLLRQTERQLIAESVVVGEAFREAYLRETGGAGASDHRAPVAPRRSTYDEPGGVTSAGPYQPIEPRLDFGFEVLPPQPASLRRAPPGATPARRAGAPTSRPSRPASAAR